MTCINPAPLPLASYRVQLVEGTAGDWRLEGEAGIYIPIPHPQPKQALLAYRLAAAST